MMRYACLIITVLAFAAGLTAYSAEPERVVLENSRLRMVIENNPAPVLTELTRKPAGMNVISEGGSSLFFLKVMQKDGQSLLIDSRKAAHGTVDVNSVEKEQKLRLTFDGFESVSGLAVAIDGSLAPDEPFVRWKLSVSNPGLLRIQSVRFPFVSAVSAIGESDDDIVIGPAAPGIISGNPAVNWPEYYSKSWTFPGIQSAQFCAYQDSVSGVYLASMDVDGNHRGLNVAREKNRINIYHEYFMSGDPVVEWSTPYETASGVAGGSWQDTADIYKRWAVQQPWCAKTLDQRNDIPAYIKAGPCIHTCGVRTYTNKYCSGSYYPQLVDHMQSLRKRIGGGPVVSMLPSWENHRRWTAGEYFPIFDEAHAVPVLKQLNEDGFFPFVYLSGLCFTYSNEGRDGEELDGWKQYSDLFVIDPETGKPKTYILNESAPGKDGVWRRHSYSFCPAASGTRDFFLSVVKRLHDLGIDFVQMDQTVSGAGDICACAEHGHQPGDGPYRSQAFWKLLADMRQYGRSLSPSFALAHEELHEEMIPFMDAFHTREYRENWWYRDMPGGRGIPLFTYLYHEYAIAYGGEGPPTTPFKSPEVIRELAVNLVTGKTPAVSVWSNQKAMAEAHTDQIRMLRNHMNLMKTEARQFLILGRMLHPLSFECETLSWKINKKPLTTPSVLTSSWQSPDGSIGHCFVNITDQPRKVELSLDTRGAQDWKKTDIELINADTKDRSSLCQGATLPQKHSLELGPLDTVFIVMRPTK